MQTNITLDWADGSYDFKLTWAGCAAVEQKSDAGIQAIYERVMLSAAYTADIVEIIRQGLLGGSGAVVDGQTVELKPARINQVLERYVTGAEAPPISENWNVARSIISAAMVGYKPAEETAQDSVKKNESQDASTLAKSSPTAP